MSHCSRLAQKNDNVKNDDDVQKFPYRIFLDLSKKLKDAEATITKMLAEREALENLKNEEMDKLKKQISELTYLNNRYHFVISNCTFCASDDAESSDASSLIDASIRVSTPLPGKDEDPASLSSTIPPLMCLKIEDRRQAKGNTVEKRKDETFILRMTKVLNKLETKYLTPEHKRKTRLFTRKQKTSPIVPKEPTYNVLAAPDAVIVPDPFTCNALRPRGGRGRCLLILLSSPSAGRGTRRGGAMSLTRRRRCKE